MEKNHLIVQHNLAAKIKFKQDFRLHSGFFVVVVFFKKNLWSCLGIGLVMIIFTNERHFAWSLLSFMLP